MARDDVDEALDAARRPRRIAALAAVALAIGLGAFVGYYRWQASRLFAMSIRLEGEGCRPSASYDYGEPPENVHVDVGGTEVGVSLPFTTREVELTRSAMFSLEAVGLGCSHLECRLFVDGAEIYNARGPHRVECSLLEAHRAGRWP